MNMDRGPHPPHMYLHFSNLCWAASRSLRGVACPAEGRQVTAGAVLHQHRKPPQHFYIISADCCSS